MSLKHEAELDARAHLAFVLMGEATAPEAEDVVAALGEIAPGAEAPLVFSTQETAILQFTVGRGGSLTLGLMPGPVPGREADDAFGFSLSAGLSETGVLAAHCAHLAVFFEDEPGRSRHEGLTRFSYLLAATAKSSKAIAIYWGDAGATHEAGFFIDRARHQDPDLMLPLWTGIEVVRDGPGRASMLSLGMRQQLGILELRVTAPQEGLGESMGTMYDILAYAARSGAAIAAGDTIGRSENEQLDVRHEPSPIDPAQTVWRIDFP